MTGLLCANISYLGCDDYRKLYETASPERRKRADRYPRREDAVCCVTAEALLRHILGMGEYRIGTHPLGKPYVLGKQDFHFNISHGGDWVVLAFGDSEVGVDVEGGRPNIDPEALAGRFFTPEEQAYILEEKSRCRERFLEIWTGKESYLKYLGTGLRKPMTSFSVLSPELEVRIHHRTLPGGYSLSLCTADEKYSFERMDARQLLQGGLSLAKPTELWYD